MNYFIRWVILNLSDDFLLFFFFEGRFIDRIVFLKDEDGEKSIEYY